MDKKTFPFKTLIWAVVAIAALVLFKPEIGNLLNNSNEIDVFGVNIKVSDQQSEELLKEQKKFEEQASDLNEQIKNQDTAIDSLNLLASHLAGQIQGCQGAQSTAKKIDSSIRNLNILNKNIKREPFLLKDYQIIKMNTSKVGTNN
ncbi:hypothetical protein [Flagellimonas eckloniae]|uniref:Uncharacterized protein n=1 Tax=Flagellimonas eckloniae TaxID=346185 RepID=A0A0Q1BKY0_9FLAO|nr:hypothetical protein [Allomuricauda eckloniae]KQC31345.1 hypothetical protein AAY42_16725 [Allomuricauda eckloniae]